MSEPVLRPRVLIFSTAYLPMVGGAELAVHELTRRLPDYDFDLVTARIRPQLPEVERVGSVTVYRVGRGRRLDKFLLPFRGRSLVRQLVGRHGPYQVFWSIMASQASILAAWAKKQFPATKLILTLQEGDTEEHLMRYVKGRPILYKIFIRPWHLRVFHRADHITAISHDLARRAKYHRPNVPIAVIPNGVDLERFRFRGPISESTYRKTNFLLITTSRLVEKNGLFDLVASLRFLPSSISLKIFGTGPDEARLRDWADQCGVASRVIFAGHADHHIIVRELAKADVFVRPSLSEGLGNSFLEAMAIGLPVVGTPVGGIPDFLKPGETGWLCRVRDPKSIAAAVQHILDPLHQEPVNRVVTQARQLIENKYDWGVLAKLMREVFSK